MLGVALSLRPNSAEPLGCRAAEGRQGRNGRGGWWIGRGFWKHLASDVKPETAVRTLLSEPGPRTPCPDVLLGDRVLQVLEVRACGVAAVLDDETAFSMGIRLDYQHGVMNG